MRDIDLVIPWVDGSDLNWQSEKSKFVKYNKQDAGFYRDWGWMRYWFRCVEENMPWLRYVFFVTYGHTPEWLNMNNPKLRVVNHKDYMLPEFLPTFNCTPISINLHRIEELSEYFIYTNDDIFFIGKQSPEDYFSEDGLPKDYLWLKPITEQFHGDYTHFMLNNMLAIKKHYDMRSILQTGDKLVFSTDYPEMVLEDNKRYQVLNYVPGFKETHMAYSFRKSSFDELWNLEAMELYKTSMHKFKTISDTDIVLFRDFQLAAGKFSPFFPKGRYFTDISNPDLKHLILDENTKMLCINESEKQGYSKARADEICSYFEERFPEKSSYEI